MIDEVDGRLTDWARSVLQSADVSFAAPNEVDKGKVVIMYLMELVSTPPLRSGRRPPLQVSLRYLVTVRSDEPVDGHRMLGELMLAAMGNSEFEVEPDPVPVEVWRAFGVGPRPSFVLRVTVTLERREDLAPLVRKPLVVKRSPIARLQGVVCGPGDVPIMGATVELPVLGLTTKTDANGGFVFAAVPSEPPAKTIRVKAKGKEVSVSADEAILKSQPLIIRLEKMEV